MLVLKNRFVREGGMGMDMLEWFFLWKWGLVKCVYCGTYTNKHTKTIYSAEINPVYLPHAAGAFMDKADALLPLT